MARVLVVDDEPAIRVLFNMILSRKGYESVMAEDADQAWELFQRGGFDAVVTDLDLKSRYNGYDLCQRIYDSGAQLPIVMVTGTDAAAREAFKPAGFRAEPYRTLSKPLPNPFYLTDVLAEAMERYRAIALEARFTDS